MQHFPIRRARPEIRLRAQHRGAAAGSVRPRQCPGFRHHQRVRRNVHRDRHRRRVPADRAGRPRDGGQRRIHHPHQRDRATRNRGSDGSATRVSDGRGRRRRSDSGTWSQQSRRLPRHRHRHAQPLRTDVHRESDRWARGRRDHDGRLDCGDRDSGESRGTLRRRCDAPPRLAPGALRPYRDAPDVGVVAQRRRRRSEPDVRRRVRQPGQHHLQPGRAWKHGQHNTFRRPQRPHPEQPDQVRRQRGLRHQRLRPDRRRRAVHLRRPARSAAPRF